MKYDTSKRIAQGHSPYYVKRKDMREVRKNQQEKEMSDTVLSK